MIEWTDELRIAVVRHLEAFAAAVSGGGCDAGVEPSLVLGRDGIITMQWTAGPCHVILRCRPDWFLEAPPDATASAVRVMDLTQAGINIAILP